MAQSQTTPRAKEFHQVPNRPDLAVQVIRHYDLHHQWDGDSPDPKHDGYLAYTVEVRVAAIKIGRVFSVSIYLGGSYYKPDELTGDVHGYFPDMLSEGIDELDAMIAKVTK